MSDTIIAPHPPNDGREWDCQCARCGSSCGHEDCGDCGGDGYNNVPIDDLDETEETCRSCGGAGGFNVCLSTTDWCDTHPIPGREAIRRGAIEWFVIGGKDA